MKKKFQNNVMSKKMLLIPDRPNNKNTLIMFNKVAL